MNARTLVWLVAGACLFGAAWFAWLEVRRETPRLESAPTQGAQDGVGQPVSLGDPSAVGSAVEGVPASERLEVVLPGAPSAGAQSAHLRFEVVALENGRAIQGAQVLCGGKSLHTDASGRGVLDVETRWTRDGVVYGVGGASGSRKFVLGRLGPGETRDVRIELPTAYERRWFGRVVDGESGEPLTGVELEAFHFERRLELDARAERRPERLDTGPLGPRGAFDYQPSVGRTVTDGDGRAQLALPSFGDQVVHVAARGYAWTARRACASEAQEPERIELLRTAHLAVRVREASGEPARGVRVSLRARAADLGADPRLSLPDLDRAATVDEDGACAFELPPRVPLTIELVRGERVVLRPNEGGDSDPRLRLEPGERCAREWTLEAGCALSGVALDEAGKPLAGLALVLREGALGDADEGWREVEGGESERAPFADLACAADGSFAVAGVPSGEWTLVALADDVELPRAAYAVRVGADEREKRLRLVLARGLTIRGTLLDPAGAPCAQASLIAESLERPFRRAERSGSDGTFEFGPLLAGRYRVSAWGEASFVVATAEARAGEAGLVLRFERGAVLRGHVTDEAGRPVSARVELAGANPVSDLFPDDAFCFERLPAGDYDLVARSDDGRVVLLRGLAVRPELAPAPVTLVLRRACEVRLQLKGIGAGRGYRVAVDGTLLERGWLEPGAETGVFVPPGTVAVSWWNEKAGMPSVPEHEEQRVLATAEEEAAVFEYELP